MKPSCVPCLRTTGVVAGELGVGLPRVQYVLRTRPHIKPSAKAGNLRVFDWRAVAMIRHEISAIDARRSRGEVLSDD